MGDLHDLLRLPVDLDVWLMLGYVVVVTLGARLMESLARFHFNRARRYSESGFRFDAELDYFACPEGERLVLHRIDAAEQIAVYRAPASSCSVCKLKGACTPHNEGRQIYRPLAAWAETDVGVFHREIARLMAVSSVAVCLSSLLLWPHRPGSGLLLLLLIASLASTFRNVRTARRAASFDRQERRRS